MPSIFEYGNYFQYLNDWILSQPRGGHGVRGKIARHLRVSPTMMSFFLSGAKVPSLEQASDLGDFLGLQEAETAYFFLLVEIAQTAGHSRLQAKLEKRLAFLRKESRKIAERVQKDLVLSDTQRATYYSSWVYTAIRNLSATPQAKDPQSLALRLQLPPATVNQVIQFLIDAKLCEQRDGTLVPGPAYTHIESDSPLVAKHHQNWRIKGFTAMDRKAESDFFYTCPMSLSATDAEILRQRLLSFVQDFLRVVRPSPSETVRCLNMDWFEY